MTSDPRERIDTGAFEVTHSKDPCHCWRIWATGTDAHPTWQDVVAVARAILAADAEWRESELLTVEQLRERYKPYYFAIAGSTAGYSAFFGPPNKQRDHRDYERHADALQWLNEQGAKQSLDAAIRDSTDWQPADAIEWDATQEGE